MNCMVTPKPPTMSLAPSRTDQRSDSARPVAKAQASIRRLPAMQMILGKRSTRTSAQRTPRSYGTQRLANPHGSHH